MREIVTTAQKATRKARRDADRRQHLKTSEPPAKPIPPDVDMADPQADNPAAGQTVRSDRGVVAVDEYPVIDLSHLLPAAQGFGQAAGRRAHPAHSRRPLDRLPARGRGR